VGERESTPMIMLERVVEKVRKLREFNLIE
jgi:hypothetical protein